MVSLVRSVFQSTYSIRSATQIRLFSLSNFSYFNPRTPYGVRPRSPFNVVSGVSYFNPRTPYGVRLSEKDYINREEPISIHVLHTECDWIAWDIKMIRQQFQSTYSIRSATHVYFPRPAIQIISIHVLHTECDPLMPLETFISSIFQSTYSIRSATYLITRLSTICMYFNPRTPYGVRHISQG
ncbi:hypothetical protein PAEAM_39020 [Paenibacillus sp. GM1FR]|nr:hypothetical protein PAEAM_39020 [Paenibacillus sp. GM1FR]